MFIFSECIDDLCCVLRKANMVILQQGSITVHNILEVAKALPFDYEITDCILLGNGDYIIDRPLDFSSVDIDYDLDHASYVASIPNQYFHKYSDGINSTVTLRRYGYGKCVGHSYSRALRITKVIFNNPATIVFWNDGTKTVVKARGEAYDPEKGLAMAISKKMLGNKHEYYDEFLHWLKKAPKEQTNIIEEAIKKFQEIASMTYHDPATGWD